MAHAAQPGFISQEPNSGLFALTYELPLAGNVGDFQSGEPSAGGATGDLIRFPGNGLMYFFSLQHLLTVPTNVCVFENRRAGQKRSLIGTSHDLVGATGC